MQAGCLPGGQAKPGAAANIGIYEIWGDGIAISGCASPGGGYGATVPIVVLVKNKNHFPKQVQ